jgi:hypothetical protein
MIALTLALARTCPVAAHDAPTLERFAVNGNGGFILMPVEFNDQKQLFILDTGATLCVFDPALQGQLIYTDVIGEVDGYGDLRIWRCRSGTLGHERIPLNSRAYCIGLDGFRKVSGQDFNGILGMDFLRRQIIQLDFDSGTVSILRTSAGITGARFDLSFNSGRIPTVTVELPKLGRTEFMIDSAHCGFVAGELDHPTFEGLVREGSMTTIPGKTHTFGIAGSSEETFGMLSRFTIGEFQHSEQLFSKGRSNKLGVGFLARYIVTFDFPKKSIVLEKAKRHAYHAPVNRLGVDFTLVDGVPIFTEVESKSLASRIGIGARDRLLAIDGKATREMTLPEIGYYLHAAPRGVLFRVSSNSANSDRDVRLPD